MSVDRHGTIAVYQAAAGNTTEVFARVFGYPPTLGHYGQHGVPSAGVLQEADGNYRRRFVLALDTGLPSGSVSVLLIGVQQLAAPIPGAPSNSLYVSPLILLPVVLDPAGDAAVSIDIPPGLSGGVAFAQWAVNDPPASGFGWVTSKGVRIEFR